MIRPALGENAFVATLARELCVLDDRAIFEEDGPETWAVLDQIEPTMHRVADLRVSLLSVGLDEGLCRAAFTIEGFLQDSPLGGPTRPRVGDYIELELSPNVHQIYRVELSREWIEDGVEADLGESELFLSLAGLWMDSEIDV
jgi:hypothetical protein